MNTHRKSLSAQTWAEIRASFAAGIPLRQLARSMHIATGTILARAKREGWSRQLKAALSKVDAPSVVDGIAGTLAEQGQQFRRNMGRAHLRVSGHVAAMPEGEILDRADKVSTFTKSGMAIFGLEKANAPANVLVQVGLLDIKPETVQASIVGPLGNEKPLPCAESVES